MDNKIIRQHNLEILIKELGSVVALSEKTDINPSYISQTRTGTKKIGDIISRKLEVGCGKTFGWMDVPHNRIQEEEATYAIDTKKEKIQEAFAFIDKHLGDSFYKLTSADKATKLYKLIELFDDTGAKHLTPATIIKFLQ